MANVSGGLPPYTYSWFGQSNQTTNSIFGLIPQIDFSVTVKDANECTVHDTTRIKEYLSTTIEYTNTSCSTCSDGEAILSIAGGTPPFTYRWTDPDEQISDTAKGLSPGTYFVYITDANGCTEVDSIVIDFTNGVKEFEHLLFKVFPQPFSAKLNISSNTEKYAVKIFTFQGKLIHTSISTGKETKISRENLLPGMYILKLTTSEGIAFTRKIVVL